MTDWTDTWLAPAMLSVGDWSLRWGAAIIVLAVVFAVRPPRRAATRLLLCQLVLVGGLLLPFLPCCWGPTLATPPTDLPAVDPAVSAMPTLPIFDRPAVEAVPLRRDDPRAELVPPTATPAVVSAEEPRELSSDWIAPAPAITAEAPTIWRTLLRVVALCWLLGFVLMAGRLVAGWIWLGRLRRVARPAGDSTLELLNHCRHETGVRRAADAITHPAVGAPVLLGGWRPAIAVAPDWEELPADSRRAALLHELTHLSRRDDWAKAGEEFVRALFFFHPLVHWLLNRLDGEREQVCDAVVVQHGIAPRQLAATLFNFAERLGAGRPAVASHVALSFFNRITVKDRIDRLLEDDMARWIRPLSPSRTTAVAAIVLGLVVALGGFGVRAGAPEDKPKPPAVPVKEEKATAAAPCTVKDADGKPLAGAIVRGITMSAGGSGLGKPMITHTKEDGSFAFNEMPDGPPPGVTLMMLAAKEGYAPAIAYRTTGQAAVTLSLPTPVAVRGIVRDRDGRPVAGARVQFGTVQRIGDVTLWGYAPEEAVLNNAIERFYCASTDARGEFRLTNAPAGIGLIFRTRADGFADADTGANGPPADSIAKADGPPVAIVLAPEGRVNGRVVRRVPGVKVEGLNVWVRPPLGGENAGFQKRAVTDAAGRFSHRGLPEGSFLVQIESPPQGANWTIRSTPTVTVKTGAICETEIELIEGIVVEGRVTVADTGKPVPKVCVQAYGKATPSNGHVAIISVTDAEGRYRLRLPPGAIELSINKATPGFTAVSQDKASVVIPEGVKIFAGPTLSVQRATSLEGRVVDARGRPVADVQIVSLCRAGTCVRVGGPKVVTDSQGRFRLEYGAEGAFPIGQLAALEVSLPGGLTCEVSTVVLDGIAEVRLPTVVGAEFTRPTNVRSDELAGVVVDEQGRPLEGVTVHMWDWVDVPKNKARTDKDGIFRIKGCERDSKVEVRFRKPGYSPVLFVQQPVGVKDLVVAMNNKTYFEGTVIGPDGKPVPGATIRGDQGPKRMEGGIMTNVWTDTKADASGHYRLYVIADAYEFEVKAPGIGVARLPKTPIANGQARALDIRLEAGVTFRALAVDATTGLPVPGVRFSSWQHKDVEGRSATNGEVAISEMLPGKFDFEIQAPGYTRWWSDEAVSPWNRQTIDKPDLGWQRNFDSLDFNLSPGMAPVKIVLEKGVKVTGRVVDPDGKPVAGATVAPALTGTGNSLTGDTRFSVATKTDGTFEVVLPASGAAQYNLIAHDGEYGQWRNWANGVLPPIRTTPGAEISGLTLMLTRPATVRGRVVDARGKPVARREVRAQSADKLENRYYDPTTTTKEDGTFELRFIRPVEHFIQAAPFWMKAETAPPGTSRNVHPAGGAVIEGIELIAADLQR